MQLEEIANYIQETFDFCYFKREMCGLIDYRFRHMKTDRFRNVRQECYIQ